MGTPMDLDARSFTSLEATVGRVLSSPGAAFASLLDADAFVGPAGDRRGLRRRRLALLRRPKLRRSQLTHGGFGRFRPADARVDPRRRDRSQHARLHTTMDADGKPLIDSTLVLWTSEFGSGGPHSNANTPVMLFGNGGGTIKTGAAVRGHRR